MKKVFLGGTCSGSSWRDKLILLLKIDYFNPVVDDWTESCQAEEERQKKECDFNLFVITPKMEGVYAIAEAVQLSLARPTATLFCVLDEDGGFEFTEGQAEALTSVKKLIRGNQASVFDSLVCVAEYLNKSYVEIAYSSNVLECSIVRDGPTQMNLGKASYLFEKNKLGDYVCEVLSADHREHLLAIPEFRVYKRIELGPAEEFTDKEEVFMHKWKHMDTDDFLAFVNGNVDKFNKAQHAVRHKAVMKWEKQLPKMACPIEQQLDLPAPEEPLSDGQEIPDLSDEAVEMAELNKDPEAEMTAFDYDFWKKWKLLGGESFRAYVKKNEQQFLNAPEFLWTKAEAKWGKLITDRGGDPWPFEEDNKDDGK